MRIDWWTLALQTVNVLILIWILARFFFRPVMDIVIRRQQEADKLLTDAAEVRQQAADARAEANEARANIATQHDKLIAEARNAAQIEKQNLLAQSSGELAKLRAEAEAAIARERTAAQAAIVTSASELSVDIAKRLLTRIPPQDTLSVFVEETCREVRQLSAAAREGLAAAAAAGNPVEIVTAAPLSAEEIERVRGALAAVFGADLPCTFRNDPAIIAGIELKGQNAIIRNSWRADLDRIRQELSRDGHASQS